MSLSVRISSIHIFDLYFHISQSYSFFSFLALVLAIVPHTIYFIIMFVIFLVQTVTKLVSIINTLTAVIRVVRMQYYFRHLLIPHSYRNQQIHDAHMSCPTSLLYSLTVLLSVHTCVFCCSDMGKVHYNIPCLNTS